jgi:hypothetical protein
MLLGFPLRLTLEVMNRRSNIYWALEINPGTAVYFDEQRVYARKLDVQRAAPSAPLGASPTPTPFSPPANASWVTARGAGLVGCAGFTTNA